MHPARWVGLIALAALLVVSSSGAAFVQGSAEIIVTADRASYAVGDPVALTIYIFDEGVAVDPLGLLVRVNSNPFSNMSRVVNATAVATGVYRSNFTLLATDVMALGSYAYAEVFVTATLPSPVQGVQTVIQQVSLRAEPAHSLQVRIFPAAANAHPGDVVDLSISVLYDGAPRDPDDLNVTLSMSNLGWGATTSYLSPTHVGTGNYSLSFTVSTDLVGPAEAVVSVRATVDAIQTTATSFYLVQGTNPFLVWQHPLETEATYALVDLWVADTQGTGVPGANVTLDYGGLIGLGSPSRSASAVTDARGRAPFNLTVVPGMFSGYPLLYSGNVTTDLHRMPITGYIDRPTSGSSTSGLTLVPEDPFLIADIGEPVRLNYTIRFEGVPMANHPIYYWVYTSQALVANATASTDNEGRISLAFTKPAGTPIIEFAANLSGQWFSVATYLSSARPLEVEVGAFRLGAPVPVNATLPSGPGPWLLLVVAIPYDGSPNLYFGPGWQPASALGLPDFRTFTSGSVARTNVTLPRFLPKDQDYLLVVESASLGMGGIGATGEIFAYARTYHVSNVPPVAKASLTPSSLLPGETVAMDASASSDPDGYAVAYRVDWGDGKSLSWNENATALHTYQAPGTYTVTVQVQDETGAVGSATYQVTVDPTILGIRSSVFWSLVAAVVAAAALIVLVVIWQWRKRRSTTVTQAVPTAPPPPSEGPPDPPPPP